MLADLGKEFGVSAPTIRKWLIREGVTLRTRAQSGNRWALKTCVACGNEFDPAVHHQRTCWTCTPTKAAMHRFRRYKVTQPQYDAQFAAQHGLCPLCLVPLKLDIDTCIDHCHDTLRFRGILCRGCNMVVARFEDDEFSDRVKDYLELCGPTSINPN